MIDSYPFSPKKACPDLNHYHTWVSMVKVKKVTERRSAGLLLKQDSGIILKVS